MDPLKDHETDEGIYSNNICYFKIFLSKMLIELSLTANNLSVKLNANYYTGKLTLCTNLKFS